MKAGAQDYLLKSDVNQSMLVRTLRYSIERSSLEWQILQSNQTLEDRVKRRTEELETARDRASKSEKLAIIGQLSGGVAHDLRNPLGAIKNAAYFLKRKCEGDWSNQSGEEFAQWIDLIDSEATIANDVITNLLSFGSTRELVCSELQICDAIQYSLENFSPSENIQLSVTVEPDLPPVMGEISQLIRVFQNLVANARDAMMEFGLISINAQRNNGSVEVVISDNGKGIAAEDLEKIFERLFTIKSHGTGLGLAICREIVNKHNGSISVESDIGTGMSFTVRIPMAA